MAVDTAQHGCTFYIAGEGEMLQLDDIHVEDHNTGEWRRPVCSGEMPLQAALYQQVPGSCLSALSWMHARRLYFTAHALTAHAPQCATALGCQDRHCVHLRIAGAMGEGEARRLHEDEG